MRGKGLVLIISVTYFLMSAFWCFFQASDFELTSNKIHNILSISMIPAYFFPFVLLFNVKKKIFRIFFAVFCVVVFVTVFPIVLLGTFIVHGDLDNGWRLVYKKPINEKTFLVVYRTPDQGALGGDDLAAALVTPVFSWLVRRTVFSLNLIKDFQANRESPIGIYVKDKYLILPSPNDLFNAKIKHFPSSETLVP